jgi:ATP-dependent RNA helicase DHX29
MFTFWLIIRLLETPMDSPLPSGTNTPRFEPDNRYIGGVALGGGNLLSNGKKKEQVKIVAAVDYDSDIDPDDLLPVYLHTKTQLFKLQPQPTKRGSLRPKGRNSNQTSPKKIAGPDSAKLLRKIKKIEDDVLFDKYLADQQWEVRRIQLERDAAAHRNATEIAQESGDSQESETLVDSDDEVSREAAKIGATLLEETGSDDDAALADLFASLPVNEVDPLTGKSTTVVNGSDGIKVTIRDFGKWTGVNPTRVLEEACRSR